MCLICELEFATKSRLQLHFRLYHRKRKLVLCGFCKMMFVKKKTCFDLSDEIFARRRKYWDQLGAAYSRKEDLFSSVALPAAATDGAVDESTMGSTESESETGSESESDPVRLDTSSDPPCHYCDGICGFVAPGLVYISISG